MASSASARRLLALWFPRLPIDRLQRSASTPSPELPLVVAAKIDNALRLTAVDGKAATLGLAPGMALATARAMLPALTVATADEIADRQLLARIADWCEAFTPFVACDPPDGLLLDITGAAHLWEGEAALLALVRSRLMQQGLTVQGAIAGTTAAARALARFKTGAIAPPGETLSFIAPLPVEALAVDPMTTQAFRRAGLKTVGAVAARGRAELAARFGADLVFRLDHVLGRAENPLAPRRPLPDYRTEQRFAEPLVTADLILATLEHLAQRLSPLLEREGQGARHLEAQFFRTDGVVRRLCVETGQPTREAAVITRLFREKLEALADPLDPGFGFDLIRLGAARVERLRPHALGFESEADQAREVGFLLDRLAARFGRDRVLTFQPRDTHIPEAAARTVPAQQAKTNAQPRARRGHPLPLGEGRGEGAGPGGSRKHQNPHPSPLPRGEGTGLRVWQTPRQSDAAAVAWEPVRGTGEAPRRPLRLFARPEPVEVIAEVPEGPPLQFRWRRALHTVAFAEGPERIAMAWWAHQALQPTRDYFRVEDSEGRRFWLYRNGIYGRETAKPAWFMHGVFS